MSFEKSSESVPKICIIGAGFAGVCAGIQLKRKLNIHSFVIIEKNHDVGGVWLTNIYPGVACDLPAAYYIYSFAPSTKWTKLYCGQEEIWNYLQNVAQTFEIYPHIQFNTSVKSMHWNNEKNKWIVTTVNDEEINIVEEYDFTVVATGPLREPSKPAQFQAFTGPIMHSAEWNSTIRLENKVVGIVGVGASAVQIVPAIASRAKELIFYQRTPAYIFPKVLQCRVPWLVKQIFKIPCILSFSRFLTFQILDHLTGSLQMKDSVANTLGAKFHRCYLRLAIKDKQLRKKFTPNKPIGVTLPALNNRFYKTFNNPNVKLVVGNISDVKGTTITTEDGNSQELDVLILCTGFKVQDFFAPIQIIGTNGVDLIEEWRSAGPRTYYGLTCHAAPNMFFLNGPNTAVFNSSVYLIELQCKFLVKMISLMGDKGRRRFDVKKSIENKCWEEVKTRNEQTLFANIENKRSYITNKLGENTFFWPNTVTIYKQRVQDINDTKFNFA